MPRMSWPNVLATGGVTVVGGVAGWFLNEVSETRRHRAQKCDEARQADTQRVLDAARYALTVASRGQTLAHGAVMKASGQVLNKDQWNDFVSDFNTAHAQLRLIESEVRLRGPAVAREPIATLNAEAMDLLNDVTALDNGNKLSQVKLDGIAALITKMRADVDALLDAVAAAST